MKAKTIPGYQTQKPSQGNLLSACAGVNKAHLGQGGCLGPVPLVWMPMRPTSPPGQCAGSGMQGVKDLEVTVPRVPFVAWMVPNPWEAL